MNRLARLAASLCLTLWGYALPKANGEEPIDTGRVAQAVERALPLLEIASSRSADQRQCFTCHHQALPVFALTEARRRGFQIDSVNLDRQLQHTRDHLARGREQYQQGKGQGGGVDTAGYALWGLEESSYRDDDVIGDVTRWLISRQQQDGMWKGTSMRPPTQGSHFTSSYLALRALSVFGDEDQQQAIEHAQQSAATWLVQTDPADTEDRVFQLLSFDYVTVDREHVQVAIEKLKGDQREDGGWAQLPDMPSDAYATATVLYALKSVANLDDQDPSWIRGIRFLLDQQLDDGSWKVTTRSTPIQEYYETGFPHRADQFISAAATAWASLVLLHALPLKEAQPIETIPGISTEPLEFPESDLSQRLMQTAHTFVESQIKQANKSRVPVLGSAQEAQSRRDELRRILGVVEERLPARMEYYGDDNHPSVVASNNRYEVLQVRWPVFEDVDGKGLWIRQRNPAAGSVVLIPDADQSPEDLLHPANGLTDNSNGAQPDRSARLPALRLAEHGFDVLVPLIVSRAPMLTDDPARKSADYTDREWIYRQAFHLGRHVIGYDLQSILSCVDWFENHDSSLPIAVVGYGEGGLLALHAAAIDTRIDAALVSGYFDSSDSVWSEPIYRNVWSRLLRLGNAEVAALVAPRKLVIEHCEFPGVQGHKGDLKTPSFQVVADELAKITDWQSFAFLVDASGAEKGSSDPAQIANTAPFSNSAMEKLGTILGVTWNPGPGTFTLVDHRKPSDKATAERIAEQRQRLLKQLQDHVQSLVRGSEAVREESFLLRAVPEFSDSRWSTERRHPTVDPSGFIDAANEQRQRFRRELIGEFDAPRVALNPRSRKVAQSENWTAYDVVLDVHEGLFAWGLLVVPNDLRVNERHPVVVCQHGRNGLPRVTLDAGSSGYNDVAAQLVERGYIVFAPHNLYRGEDRYRWLDRKANTIGCTLFSFIVAQHQAHLDWLQSLPFVDPERIAFYGLSYGGETAVRVPPLLDGYCLSICSGDFNQWTRKVASTEHSFSFMNTIEWEMPYWNLGHTFDYAEMAYLMFPRPFMVERGHHDRVGKDSWVAYEFAKVRWLYAQFGMSDRVDIEFFQGGHSINGEGTFEFLDRWLKPKP